MSNGILVIIRMRRQMVDSFISVLPLSFYLLILCGFAIMRGLFVASPLKDIMYSLVS